MVDEDTRVNYDARNQERIVEFVYYKSTSPSNYIRILITDISKRKEATASLFTIVRCYATHYLQQNR